MLARTIAKNEEILKRAKILNESIRNCNRVSANFHSCEVDGFRVAGRPFLEDKDMFLKEFSVKLKPYLAQILAETKAVFAQELEELHFIEELDNC